MLCFKNICTTHQCANSFCTKMFISQLAFFNSFRLPPMWTGRCCVRCPGWAPKNQWCRGDFTLRTTIGQLETENDQFQENIVWMIDWLMDGLMDWWIDGLMDWLMDGLLDWLIVLIGSCRLLVSCVHSYRIMNGNQVPYARWTNFGVYNCALCVGELRISVFGCSRKKHCHVPDSCPHGCYAPIQNVGLYHDSQIKWFGTICIRVNLML